MKKKRIIGITLVLLCIFVIRKQAFVVSEKSQSEISVETTDENKTVSVREHSAENITNTIKTEVKLENNSRLDSAEGEKSEMVTIQDAKVANAKGLLEFDYNHSENTSFTSNENIVYVQSFNSILESVYKGSISGEGFLRWNGWNATYNEKYLSGNLYIPYINDSIYTSMKLPSEVPTMMNRKNASIFRYQQEGYTYALGIGSIYQVTGSELPEEFDIYFGKTATYVLTKDNPEQWKVLFSANTLASNPIGMLHDLPWDSGKSYKIDKERIEKNDKYTKIHLTKEDLNNKVLHFWNPRKPVNSSDIIGIVHIYEVWTDNEAAVGGLAAAIGVDLKDESNNNIFQAFSGRNYMVTTSPRKIIGHNIPDEVYVECVNNGVSPQICEVLFDER